MLERMMESLGLALEAQAMLEVARTELFRLGPEERAEVLRLSTSIALVLRMIDEAQARLNQLVKQLS